ncbi:MAG TPA: DNA mismatch repair endonuclease MutL, partial [Methanothrix sp.]|nr:DNA mismatch repair endonuclease MutL [Methanothrix sp.]
VAEGGKAFIRVTDDGSGIVPQDLPLAFQKHATSKISRAEDLAGISTLGFRGEALASIASVSGSVEVKTKTRGAISGTYIRLEQGRIVESKDIGSPAGTTITVWDLFYNVPARKKHLKAAEAELVYIVDALTEMAVVHHDISFELFSGKRTLFKSARSPNWDDVLLRLFGIKTLKAMSRIKAQGQGWSISGVVGDPLSVRSSPDRIMLFVNGRAVSSRILSGALREAYRNIIPLSKSPVAVISLQVDPTMVDVNVHPTKREIRLLREGEIAAALTAAAAAALERHARPSRKEASIYSGQAEERAREAEETRSGQMVVAESGSQSTLPLASTDERPVPLPRPPRLRILGQIKKLYIAAEGEDGLVLIDQHAAAERIRFEMLQDRYRSRRIRQDLVAPLSIELSASERVVLASWQDTLQDIGFDISPFGGNTYTVRAVPATGRYLESAESVHDLLRDLFLSGKASPASSDRDDILKLLACRGSIKSGRELSPAEMKRLIDDLFLCRNPMTCPHGRPVMVSIEEGRLERLFSRR